MERINAFVEKRHEVGKQIVEAVKEVFPVGMVVAVKRGKGEMVGRVHSYGSFWACPHNLVIENIKTGRLQNVDCLKAKKRS